MAFVPVRRSQDNDDNRGQSQTRVFACPSPSSGEQLSFRRRTFRVPSINVTRVPLEVPSPESHLPPRSPSDTPNPRIQLRAVFGGFYGKGRSIESIDVFFWTVSLSRDWMDRMNQHLGSAPFPLFSGASKEWGDSATLGGGVVATFARFDAN